MRCLGFAFAIASPAGAFAVSTRAGTGPGGATPILGPILGTTTGDWSVEVVTEDLNYPWDIDRAGDRILMTEAGGTIVTIEDGRLNRYPVETSDPIVHDGGGGLLGMALSPTSGRAGWPISITRYRSASGLTNKVIQARFDGASWRETRVLLKGTPGHRLLQWRAYRHRPSTGSCIVTTGWTKNRERPQDLGSLAGKILRMTPDGQVPADNPFPGSYVYSTGHRNPQGLAWNEAGDLFVVEHGQSAHDEINLVRPGANYGWPLIDGDRRRAGMETALLHSAATRPGPRPARPLRGPELPVAARGVRGGSTSLDEAAWRS